MTKEQEHQLDMEFVDWLHEHNFPKDLPEHVLKLLRTVALLTGGA